jgi:hypothetical protein
MYAGELFQYEKVAELRPNPKRPESYLQLPQRVVRGPIGTILVLDLNGNRIAVFDEGGAYLKNIGRYGFGPGELVMPITLEYRQGIISTFAYQQQRLTLYSAEGVHLRSITPPQDVMRLNQHLEWAGSDTILVHRRIGTKEQGPYSAHREVDVYDGEWHRVASMTTPQAITGARTPIIDFVDDYLMLVDTPFSGNPTATYSRRHGLLVTTGDDPILSFYALTGEMRKQWSFDIPREDVVRADRRAVRDELDRNLRDAIEGGYLLVIARAKTALQNLKFPDAKAHWVSANIDDAGYIWLMAPTHHVLQASGDTTPWFVISPRGEYLGRTERPVLKGHSVSGGVLMGIEIDPETDGQIPVLYRVTGNYEGLGR